MDEKKRKKNKVGMNSKKTTKNTIENSQRINKYEKNKLKIKERWNHQKQK